MYQSKSKIIKVDGSKPTEIEEDVGKSLQQLQMSKDDLKVHLNQITITNVDLVEYKQRDGAMSKALHVKIPFRCTPAYAKVSHQIIEHLEEKFKWPVIITANRTIQSKRGKCVCSPHKGVKAQRENTPFGCGVIQSQLIFGFFSKAPSIPTKTKI